MKEAAYQLAVIVFVLATVIGGLMALESAVLSARDDHAMNLQRIAWQSYRHHVDMKNLPRSEWRHAF